MDAYSFIRDYASATTKTLRDVNANNHDTQLHLSKIILRMKQVAAMFTPVEQMSPATKDLLTFYYKNSVFPVKIFLMQLNNKRTMIK